MMEQLNLTTKILIYSMEECNMVTKNLIEAAKRATANAYSPYSAFAVGAAILLANGEVIVGNNQENAAYSSGLCAERTAIFYANATYPLIAVEAIAIAAYHNGMFTDRICSPCGACRQVLAEVADRYNSPMRIIMYGSDKIYEVASIDDLLPLRFGEDMLE